MEHILERFLQSNSRISTCNGLLLDTLREGTCSERLTLKSRQNWPRRNLSAFKLWFASASISRLERLVKQTQC